jgi:predicted transcriptional regulator
MSKKNLKESAILFRGKGYSIKEIAKLLEVAQSTVSLWVRDVKLSEKNRKRIEANKIKGRKRAAETNRNKKLQRELRVIRDCEVFKKNTIIERNDAKIYLSLLYWGEGAKTGNRVVITNSDPDLINIFSQLLRKCFKVDDSKMRGILHLHSYHDEQEMINFWSKCSGVKQDKISVYHKKESGISIKNGYKGCFSIRYGDVATLQEILLVINRFKLISL